MIKTIAPKLAEVGKIKIGGKGKEAIAKNGNKYRIPVKFDHFVIVKNEKDSTGLFSIDNEIMKKIGDNCKELKIKLLFDSIEKNLLTNYALYDGHKCKCMGDGEKAVRTFTKDGKDTKKEIECTNGACEFLTIGKCKPSAILSCILDDASTIGGVYKFRTHSWNSVQNLMSSLAYIATQTGGKLAGIPLMLHIVKKTNEEHGNLITVNISFNGDTDKLRAAVLAEIKRREEFRIDIKQLEMAVEKTGILLDNDDPSDIEDEFYSQNKEKLPITEKSKTINASAFEIPASVIIDSEIVETKSENIGGLL